MTETNAKAVDECSSLRISEREKKNPDKSHPTLQVLKSSQDAREVLVSEIVMLNIGE